MEDQNDREKRYPGLPIEREEDRNRLYFVADTAEKRSASLRDGKTEERSADPQPGSHRELSDRTARRCPSRLLANAETSQRWTVRKEHSRGRTPEVGGCSGFDRGGLGYTDGPSASRFREHSGESAAPGRLRSGLGDHGELGNSIIPRLEEQRRDGGVSPSQAETIQGEAVERTGSPVNGFWSDAEWIYCRDDTWRPVESGTFPLAHGAAARVGRLRGYGNAICAPVAEEFIRAYMEVLP